MSISASLPDPVNLDLLFEEVTAVFNFVHIDYEFSLIVVDDVGAVQATLDAIVTAHNASGVTQEQQIQADKQSLKDLIDLAQDYSAEIRAIFNNLLTATKTQTTQNARSNDLYTLIDAMPSPFKTRFYNDVQEELGLDIPALVTGGTITLNQRRQFCLYTRTWITPLAVLLTEA